MALTKVTSRMTDGASLNVLDFGAIADGVTDDSNAFQAAIAAALNVAGDNPRSPRLVKEVYIPEGQYLISKPILLYQSDGIRIRGAGPMNTQIIVGSDQSGFTYPAEWQALTDYASYVANPAIFQVAKRRVTGVGNPGAGWPNLANTGYLQAGAAAAPFYLGIEDIGFFARDTSYYRNVKGIYGVDAGQVYFQNWYAEGMNTVIHFDNLYAAKIGRVRVYDCQKPIYIGGGTSVDVANCGATYCTDGYTIISTYASANSLGVDHWGVGYYAYTVGGISFVMNGCGSENGLGGIVYCVSDPASGLGRYGVQFNSCVFQGGATEGAINYTGQTTIGDFGVPAMFVFEGCNLTFTNCGLLSEISTSGGTTYFGAQMTDDVTVTLNLPSDPAVRANRQALIFHDYATIIGTVAGGFPKINFTYDPDKDYGFAQIAADETIGSNVTFVVPWDTLVQGDPHLELNTSTGEWVCVRGGQYKFAFGGTLNGDQYSYVSIQVTSRPSGASTLTPLTRVMDNLSNVERAIYFEATFDLYPGDTIRCLIRRLTTANPGYLEQGAYFNWEQIA